MIGWLQLSEEQKRTSLEQAAVRSNINVKAIEKDWWVTITLKALFQSKYNDHLVFKGGTSLSKCWKLIERFSEDIDIAMDPEVLGLEYKDEPSKNYIDKLRKLGCAFTSNELRRELILQFEVLGMPEGMITIEALNIAADKTDTDPQTLLVKYPSLFDPNPYLADVVKIEVSVRSMKEPFGKSEVQSLLNEYFPNPIYDETPFMVMATSPQRTFLEKAFLLHEEFSREDADKIKYDRMSRHLYDVERMMDKEPGIIALADSELYTTILHHRRFYTAIRRFNYDTLKREQISFIPPDNIIEAYKNDYAIMQEQMIYGDSPEFDILVNRLNELLARFRSIIHTK